MLDTQRPATIADIVNRLTDTQHLYEKTAIAALGWGMGPAQLGISEAVAVAAHAGYVIVTEERGKKFVHLAPLFTLISETKTGVSRREGRPARAVETIGRVLMRMADRGEVWNIQVLDKDGVDVTFDFACFCD
jgi:hypothetical protein